MLEVILNPEQNASLMAGVRAAIPMAAKSVALHADCNVLTVAISDGANCTLSLNIACKTSGYFDVACESKLLIRALKAAGKADIHLYMDSDKISVHSQEHTVFVPTVQDVPVGPLHLLGPMHDFCSVGVLRDALQAVVFAMPEYDTNKLFLNGTYFTSSRVIASDGYRLAYASLNTDSLGAENPLLLARSCAATLARLTTSPSLAATEMVAARYADGLMTLMAGNWTLTGTAISDPENYARMEKGLAHCATNLNTDIILNVSQQKLFKAIQSCPDALLSLVHTPGVLTILSYASRTAIEVKYLEKSLQVRFNRKYLRDALNAHPKGEVTLILSEQRLVVVSCSSTNVVMCVRS